MPKISGLCNKPLEFNDFNRYDVVPDGKLYKSEISDERLSCFITQLAHTHDRNVLQFFTDAIQTDLWEITQEELSRLKPDKIPEKSVPVVERLLNYDFSNRQIKGAAAAQYNFTWYSVRNGILGAVSREKYVLHQLKGSGSFQANIPVGRWRLKSNLNVTGKESWADASQRNTDLENPTMTDERKNYPGITADAIVTLVKRNSEIQFDVNGGVEKNWNPLSDQLDLSTSLGGSLAFRNILDSNLSLSASANWTKNDYAPPLDPTFHTRKENIISTHEELSYLYRRKSGAVLTHDFEDNHTISSFYNEKREKHLPSLLAHISLSNGYIRVGGGGGAWKQSLQLLGEPAVTSYYGAEAHGTLEVLFEPKKWFNFKFNAYGYANYSEGDFNGWFPGWAGSAEMTFMFGPFVFSVSGNVEGSHKTLEHRQTVNTGWVTSTMKFNPSEKWNLMLNGGYTFTEQNGYQEFNNQTWMSNLVVGRQLFSRPDTWLEILGSYGGSRYRQTDYSRDRTDVAAQAFMKIRF